MVECSKVNLKLSDTQLKLVWWKWSKMLDGNDLPHELVLTTRQKTKLRNAFNNNMSTDLTLSKAHISNKISLEDF